MFKQIVEYVVKRESYRLYRNSTKSVSLSKIVPYLVKGVYLLCCLFGALWIIEDGEINGYSLIGGTIILFSIPFLIYNYILLKRRLKKPIIEKIPRMVPDKRCKSGRRQDGFTSVVKGYRDMSDIENDKATLIHRVKFYINLIGLSSGIIFLIISNL